MIGVSMRVTPNGKVFYLPKGPGGAGSSQKRKSKAMVFLSQVQSSSVRGSVTGPCVLMR